MKRIGVIINPRAKGIRRMSRSAYEEFFTIDKDIFDVRVTDTVEELKRSIEDFKSDSIDAIGIAGGDGSLHFVLNAVIEVCGEENVPPVLIIKSGTMDNVSRSVIIRGKGPDVLKRLHGKIINEENIEFVRRDTLNIDGRYGFIFGAGMVTNFLHEVYGGTEKGLARNLRTIGKALVHAVMPPARGNIYQGLTAVVSADGRTVPFEEITAILGATVEHIGMGFSPLMRACDRERTFQIIITGLRPLQIVSRLPVLKKGRQVHHPQHFDAIISKIDITAEGPFEYTIDGDIYSSAGVLSIKTGPSVRFVRV